MERPELKNTADRDGVAASDRRRKEYPYATRMTTTVAQ